MQNKKRKLKGAKSNMKSILNIFLIDISNGKRALYQKLDDRIESLWKNDAIDKDTKDEMKRVLVLEF